ncbi:MAG: hypothetical protein IKS68_03820 [Mailhella sp.]|nr:hypothetical protein [Mailhella sp.]
MFLLVLVEDFGELLARFGLILIGVVSCCSGGGRRRLPHCRETAKAG